MKNLIYTQYRPVARYIREEKLERTVNVAEAIADFIANTWHALQAPPRDEPVVIDGRAITPDAEHFMRFAPR